MSKDRIIGRNHECERLQECLEETNAQLVIVNGRRRVGKTFLVNEFFDNKFAFKLTGSYHETRKNQLRNFSLELGRKLAERVETPDDWPAAFCMLRNYLESLDQSRKQIVFFDEMPWLDGNCSGFLPAFEFFWNDFGCAMHNLVFIVCGSATSWMSEKIERNKGGLFNRLTCKLYLEPFNLFETEMFLNSKGFHWSHYDIAECYMIMGGIPYYLNLLKKSLSLNQNIDRLFFENKCELWDEFSNLYSTLFSNDENYIKIVEALSHNRYGLSRKELALITKLASNGDFSEMLERLSSSGFIKEFNFYGHDKKESRYQLSDYYTAFYFHFIKEHYGKDEHFWSNCIDNPSRRAWEGLTFEALCKVHIQQIKQRLGILGVLSEESIWYKAADKETDTPGAQIDLLISRRDEVINLCEIKYSRNEFIIDKSYEMSLRNKLDYFVRSLKTRKSIQITFITTYGLKKNMYSGIVSNQIVIDDLFKELVNI